jgi:hypothetical protein
VGRRQRASVLKMRALAPVRAVARVGVAPTA